MSSSPDFVRKTKAEIVAKFGSKSNDPEILNKCLEIMKIFQLTVDDLFVKWESYVMTTSVDNDLALSVENLERLHQRTQDMLNKQNMKSPMNTLKVVKKPAIRAAFGSPNNNGLMNMSILSTPISSAKKRKLETPRSGSSILSANASHILADSSNMTNSPDSPSIKKNINDSGKILETLNASIPLKPSSVLQSKISIAPNFNPIKYKFRTMNQKLLESADVLDEQIDSTAKIILEHYKLDQSEFGNPCVASPVELITVGRIVPDSPLTPYDAELNSSSLFLETSRLGGIGQRVSLDLSKLPDYSFFPGQVVALKGRNPNGEFFQPSKIYDIPYLGAPATSEEDLLSFYGDSITDANSQDTLKIVTTCGPYTSNNDLDYTQLRSFVEKMNEEVKPQLIIMLGPFIDITHPKIREGNLSFPELDEHHYPKTLDGVFKSVLSPILKRLTCQVILLPSTRDVSSKHAAYPQDSLDRKLLELPKNFKCFPNPCSFQLNEFLVGVSNTDIFKDLKDVTHGTLAKTNRFDRIVDHVLQQRRYYPLFPGSIKTKTNSLSRGLKSENAPTEDGENQPEHISGVDLHVPYMGLTELGDVTPEILIMPSELKQFAKVTKGLVVVNPGNFMKPNSNGTYGVMTINAPKIAGLTKLEGNQLYLNDLWKRTRVDLIKS